MVDIKRITEGDHDLITIVGEIDASSSLELDRTIDLAIKSGRKRFLVDCSSLEYISSAGLGVFMSYIEEFNKNNVNIVLYGLNDKVFNVFEILGLDQLLNIKEDKEEAVRSL